MPPKDALFKLGLYQLVSGNSRWTSCSSQVAGDHDVEHEREHEVDGHVEVGDDEGEEGEHAGVAARTDLQSASSPSTF